MTGLLAYDPHRLATLATNTKAVSTELGSVAADEPCCVDAVGITHGIAASLDEALLLSLRAVLLSTAMTEWIGVRPLTVDELIHALTGQMAVEPNAPFVLDAAELDLATAISPSDPNTWFDAINPACVAFPGGSYGGGGYVSDHHGIEYPVVVPRVATDEGAVYTADLHPATPGDPSVATLGGSDPGWEVVGCAEGIARFQEAPSPADAVWGFLAGTTGLVRPLPPNSGLVHIAVPTGGGPPHLVDEPPTPGPVVVPQSGAVADPFDTSPAAIVEGGAALALTAAQGGVMGAALDNQTQRAYQVIFEENADGRRRARIQTYTLAHDGEGDVVIVPEHVYVDGEGRLTSQTISYGSPYDADGVYLTGSTTDVADVALSGNEPMTYRITGATFP